MRPSPVYLPGGEQSWLTAPKPLWHRRLRIRGGRIVFRAWCAGCLVVIGVVAGGLW